MGYKDGVAWKCTANKASDEQQILQRYMPRIEARVQARLRKMEQKLERAEAAVCRLRSSLTQ